MSMTMEFILHRKCRRSVIMLALPISKKMQKNLGGLITHFLG